MHYGKEKKLKPFLEVGGYLKVQLYKNGTTKKCKVHRLVAKAFIPNHENKPQVNHINGIKTDNRIENLEWCDNSENQLHAYKNNLHKRKYGKDHYNSVVVNQYDIQGRFLRKWYCVKDIERQLGFDNRNICACCRHKIPTAYGYKWEYEKEK